MTDVTIRNPPPAVKAALRTVHQLVVHQRPYEESASALDAAAALPEATEPDAAALIAMERHALLWRYTVSDEETARAIELTRDELAKLPVSERAWLLRCACSGRPALAERYLAPLIAELEERVPESTRTIELLRDELSIARGEPQPVEADEDVEDLASSPKFPEELIDGIRYAYRLRRMGWPYEDAIAVLDEVGTLPSAAQFPGQLATDRIILTSMFERPDADMEREIERALQAEPESPAWVRAMTISNACDGRATLAERYMPALIADAEAELRAHPDEVAQQYLDGVKLRLERTRAG
jgi:hypothetical protein